MRRDSSYAATSSGVKVMAVGLRRSMMIMMMILGRWGRENYFCGIDEDEGGVELNTREVGKVGSYITYILT